MPRIHEFLEWLGAAFQRRCCGLRLPAGFLRRFAVVLLLVGLPFPKAFAATVTTIGELRETVTRQGRTIESFVIEGIVCAVIPETQALVLQDSSATALIEIQGNERFRIGDRLQLRGDQCTVTRGRFGIQIGSAPVVNNDGTHAELAKSGSVFLTPGRHPVRLLWFSRGRPGFLRVEYEGPGVSRQVVPPTVLWQEAGIHPSHSNQPGLRYTAYSGQRWYAVPDVSKLQPLAEGLVTNFSLPAPLEKDPGAMAVDGFLEIRRAGVYTFHVASAAGSKLYLGIPSECLHAVVAGRQEIPVPTEFEKAQAGEGSDWVVVEGVPEFIGPGDDGLQLEIVNRTDSIPVTILSRTMPAKRLTGARIRAVGVLVRSHNPVQSTVGHVIVPGMEHVELVESVAASEGKVALPSLITTAGDVQRLKPAQAHRQLAVRLKGVITQASPTSIVLQDFSGGVFIHFAADDWTQQPRIGDVWQIEGTTDPGDFSPVVRATNGVFLGSGTLPEPIRPTWDQLMNGSLDAQYVELQGVVISVADTGMQVLTRDGKVKVVVDEMRRSYSGGRDLFVQAHIGVVPVDDVQRSYEGSEVRIRGCLVAVWNSETRQVKAGEVRLVASVVNVLEPRPPDPFSLETHHVADLFLFDPRANALKRTKISGSVVYARPRECCVQDGDLGIRIETAQPVALQTGDVIEAVGYPRVGGPYAMLLEATVRTIGRASSPPPPRAVAWTNMPDHKLDSTLVTVDAMLLKDSLDRAVRVLELQAGPHRFLARLDKTNPGKPISVGSRLKLTGVYASTMGGHSGGRLDAFELLLNRPGDIVILERPSWWTLRRALSVIATLVVVLGLALIWITMLRKKVEERTAQLQTEIEERQRAEQRRAIAQERTRVAQDLHDELGAGLTEVGILGSLAKAKAIPAETKEGYVDQLTDVARSLVTSLDEIVWAVNPQYDSVDSLATYYSLFAQRFLDLAGIACRFQINDGAPDHRLDSRLRHGMFRAFKESLNNIVRHSGATEVRLAVETTAGDLMLSVTDNGRGFDVNRQAPGADGLAGMRQRMQDLGGSCEINSEPGHGTAVVFRLPLKGHQHDQSGDS